MKKLSPEVLADAEGHLAVLESSDLDWTVVRAPRAQDTPNVGSYRVGNVGGDSSTSISRAAPAGFILSQVEDRPYLRQLPFVSA